MTEDFMEYLVKKKKEPKDYMLRAVSIGMLVVSIMSIFVVGVIGLLLTIILIALMVIFIFPSTDIEYEYLYCDKTLTVDVIKAQKSRKTIAEFEMERMEIVAPVDSDKLADYKNRQVNVLEFWSKEYNKGENNSEDCEHSPYAIYYDGNTKIILDLPEKFVKIMQMDGPRKVFIK